MIYDQIHLVGSELLPLSAFAIFYVSLVNPKLHYRIKHGEVKTFIFISHTSRKACTGDFPLKYLFVFKRIREEEEEIIYFFFQC